MLIAVLLSLASGGCVERTLAITSTPSGALVYLNDEEVGRTPLKRPFLWYGNYDLALRKDGYETLKTTQDLKAPLCQIVPFDLFAELLPIQFKDEQSFTYTMQPLQSPDPQALLQRAAELKGQLQGPEHPATRPAGAK
jgi:PEGA domain-containing protein